METNFKPRIGISTCLLGESVRYNGGHLKDAFLTNTVSKYVEWVPVCPEAESGMGIPREPVRLVEENGKVKMKGVKSKNDHSVTMEKWTQSRIDELKDSNLHGYVFTKDSPSCGLFRVKTYGTNDQVVLRNGRGKFADALSSTFENLPVEENGRLNDPRLRENFIERVFVYKRWTELIEEGRSPRNLIDFHSQLKLTLMAHSVVHYREAGRIVARAGIDEWNSITNEYENVLMSAMQRLATAKKHANALQHAMGFLKQDLSSDDKIELMGMIDQYRVGQLPIIVPVTLLRHHINKIGGPKWLTNQTYLDPYPSEMMLRNHV